MTSRAPAIPADYGFPPLCLDLHYLSRAHGATDTGPDADLQAQLILGDAMRVLHENPVLVDGLDASLTGAAIRLKLILQRASIEELSKIWTSLPGHRVSALGRLQAVARPDRESAPSAAVRAGPDAADPHDGLAAAADHLGLPDPGARRPDAATRASRSSAS